MAELNWFIPIDRILDKAELYLQTCARRGMRDTGLDAGLLYREIFEFEVDLAWNVVLAVKHHTRQEIRNQYRLQLVAEFAVNGKPPDIRPWWLEMMIMRTVGALEPGNKGAQFDSDFFV